MENYSKFLELLIKEINYQAEKWADGTWEGLATHDLQQNNLNDFIVYITKYASRNFVIDIDNEEEIIKFRNDLIKVAALAYSAFVYCNDLVDDSE